MLKRKILSTFFLAAMVTAIAANSYAGPASSDSPAFPTVYVILKTPHEVYVGHRRTSLDGLIADIETEDGHADPRTVRILMQSNPSVDYDTFASYLKRLQRAGYMRVGLISDTPARTGSSTSK